MEAMGNVLPVPPLLCLAWRGWGPAPASPTSGFACRMPLTVRCSVPGCAQGGKFASLSSCFLGWYSLALHSLRAQDEGPSRL